MTTDPSRPLRILFCGGRTWENRIAIETVMTSLHRRHGDIQIIHGNAPGADTIAKEVAQDLGLEILPFPAHWRHTQSCEAGCTRMIGPAAGPIRNKQMLVEGKPDLVFAFHEDIAESKGTKNMVEIAGAAGVPTRIITLGGPGNDPQP